MFKLVKLPESNLPGIILFDSREFKPADYNLVEVKELTLDDIKSEYASAPIMSLMDFMLRTVRPKERTVSHILSECGIETFKALENENNLINLKQSK